MATGIQIIRVSNLADIKQLCQYRHNSANTDTTLLKRLANKDDIISCFFSNPYKHGGCVLIASSKIKFLAVFLIPEIIIIKSNLCSPCFQKKKTSHLDLYSADVNRDDEFCRAKRPCQTDH